MVAFRNGTPTPEKVVQIIFDSFICLCLIVFKAARTGQTGRQTGEQNSYCGLLWPLHNKSRYMNRIQNSQCLVGVNSCSWIWRYQGVSESHGPVPCMTHYHAHVSCGNCMQSCRLRQEVQCVMRGTN